jgi:hypothetical protein
MLHRLHDYARLAIFATDGKLGRLSDCLFDDARWKIRYVLVNASLFARKIAVSPLAIRHTHWTSGEMTSCLALKHLGDGAGLLATSRTSRTGEHDDASCHVDQVSSCGPALWTWVVAPGGAGGRSLDEHLVAAVGPAVGNAGRYSYQLRSLTALCGMHLHIASFGPAHVDDVMVDDRNWSVSYLLMDASNGTGRHTHLVPSAKVTAIDWAAGDVYLDLTRELVETSPAFDTGQPFDRASEDALTAHYGCANVRPSVAGRTSGT